MTKEVIRDKSLDKKFVQVEQMETLIQLVNLTSYDENNESNKYWHYSKDWISKLNSIDEKIRESPRRKVRQR